MMPALIVPPVISITSSCTAPMVVRVTVPVPASIVKLASSSRAIVPWTNDTSSLDVLIVCAALISMISAVSAVVNIVAPLML